MELDNKIKDGLKVFGQDFVLSLAEVLRKADKRASGKLIASLNYDLLTLVKDVNYQIEINGLDYFEQVNLGRKPGKQPPLSKIRQWTKLKGIDQRAAYPIARKIGKFGIAPTNALNEAINQIDFGKLESDLNNKFIVTIQNELNKEIK